MNNEDQLARPRARPGGDWHTDIIFNARSWNIILPPRVLHVTYVQMHMHIYGLLTFASAHNLCELIVIFPTQSRLYVVGVAPCPKQPCRWPEVVTSLTVCTAI